MFPSQLFISTSWFLRESRSPGVIFYWTGAPQLFYSHLDWPCPHFTSNLLRQNDLLFSASGCACTWFSKQMSPPVERKMADCCYLPYLFSEHAYQLPFPKSWNKKTETSHTLCAYFIVFSSCWWNFAYPQTEISLSYFLLCLFDRLDGVL